MLERSVIIALAVYFLHALTWEGMILARIQKLAYNWPVWIKKPLFDCPICMVPWYGSLILAVGGLPCDGLMEGLMILLAAGGFNAALVFFIPFEHGNGTDD